MLTIKHTNGNNTAYYTAWQIEHVREGDTRRDCTPGVIFWRTSGENYSHLSGGVIYIMNDSGKTIDAIRT